MVPTAVGAFMWGSSRTMLGSDLVSPFHNMAWSSSLSRSSSDEGSGGVLDTTQVLPAVTTCREDHPCTSMVGGRGDGPEGNGAGKRGAATEAAANSATPHDSKGAGFDRASSAGETVVVTATSEGEARPYCLQCFLDLVSMVRPEMPQEHIRKLPAVHGFWGPLLICMRMGGGARGQCLSNSLHGKTPPPSSHASVHQLMCAHAHVHSRSSRWAAQA